MVFQWFSYGYTPIPMGYFVCENLPCFAFWPSDFHLHRQVRALLERGHRGDVEGTSSGEAVGALEDVNFQ